MFGAFMDAVMAIPNNMMMEEDRNQRQQDNWGLTFNEQAYNAEEAQKGRDFNSAQAAVQREYLTEMSNTQHQRQQADLRKAGLNPILAARQGAGTPSASAASSGAASSSGSSSTGTSTPHVQSNFAAAQVMEEQKDNLAMDTRLKDANRNLASQQYNESQARTDFVQEQTATQRESTRRERADADSATADAKGRTNEGDIDDTSAANILRWINRISESLQGASSASRRARQR